MPELARDPGLPQRDLLLDAAAIRDRLARLLAAGRPTSIGGYERARVKYRIGESLRIVHRIEVDGKPQLLASRTWPPGERARPARAFAHDHDLGTAFWSFPNDRKIATLAVLDPSNGALSELLGRRLSHVELAAYAPEKSATAACMAAVSGAPVAYAKVYAEAGEAMRANEVHATLAERVGNRHPALRLPAALGCSESERLLTVEALAGRRVDTLRGRARLDALRRVGAAVATFHTLPPPANVPAFHRLAPARQPRAAALIARARPDLMSLATRLAAELESRPPVNGEAPVCLHGDLHLKNSIELGGRVALIDLDQVSVGAAAAELGSVLAGLRYQALLAGRDDGDAAGTRALLAGYDAVRPVPRSALSWHTAAALLSERALRAVNRIRPDGLAHLGAVLRDGRAILAGSGP